LIDQTIQLPLQIRKKDYVNKNKQVINNEIGTGWPNELASFYNKAPNASSVMEHFDNQL